jgi:alcohol dehydrogenase (cytochrome c)
MRRTTRSVLGLGIVSVLILSLSAVALGRVSTTHSAKVSIPAFATADLNATPGDDWITQSGNLWGQRHSSANLITPANVTGLKEAWHVKLNAPKAGDPLLTLNAEAPQLEYKGTLFAEDALGRVYAKNAATGVSLWYYEPHNKPVNIPKAAKHQKILKIVGPWASTRGLAINDGTVYAEELLGNVIALDANTGKLKWSTQIAPISTGIGLSQPPTYYEGMILGATSGGDTGFSCIVFALDAKTGKMLWKFNIIPSKPGQPGYDTWAHPLAFNGGGAVWTAMTVDSASGLVYAATGNPIPYSGLLRGPGKEYYTDGVLALNAKTGKLAWFFQEVHHDNWDADQSQQSILYGLKYNGTMRHALASANKDGLLYLLDRVTGKPILPVTEMKVQQSKEVHTWPTQPIPSTDPLVPQNVPDRAKWKGLTAADGKPYNIGSGGPAGSFTAIDSTRYTVTAAFGQGASGNKPASIDPDTGYLIEETTPGFSTFKATPVSELAKVSYFNFDSIAALKFGVLKGTPAAAVAGTRVSATNLATGKLVWTVDHLNSHKPSNAFGGGVMTSPGLVWASSGKQLQAYDEKNGKLLWSSPQLKSTPFSPPTTFLVGGKQYVTIFLGGTSDLYAFALPSTTTP